MSDPKPRKRKPRPDPIEKLVILGVDIRAVLRDGYSPEDPRVQLAVGRHPLVRNLRQMKTAVSKIGFVPEGSNMIRLEITQ